ncbi:glycosyltransferase family 39 protein [Actinokineospora bangkokensis]|uniref:Glycosyl transferase n=1 Tax=Actinokineospora bangkokensis TaxID=1193682 RepID=A0A1Q9LPP8_9PSEU|nr:glycosyltransferase family 39 protein [Actinokineospora bangkokensis]OLR93995.1 glycosyl transferase [Actinokineospora bangkokensis]
MTTLLSRLEPGARHRAADHAPPVPRRRRVLRGPASDPSWARPALLVLLAMTAVLYTWNLTASGYGNEFYAAAVQAGTQSWKAWLFGSLDSGNAITVDKPPAALWVATAFARVLGFSSFSVLLPQALMGVAAVGLLHATVKRVSGPAAGLVAGAALALTPVAVLMFRFNNPDALLVLLMVAAAYCVTRATEKASGTWLALAGVAIGFAFLTKMMQGFLVLPAFALVYLVAAPTSVGKRLAHLAGALAAVIAAAGWYIALVELWPASSRPYIGGSTTNSLLELALGYNGLGRILGGEGNGGGGGGTGFGGSTGLFRMFGSAFGSEVSWLLPAALVGLVAGLWLTRRAPRTDRTRAALLLWGGWLLVTALVFSFMSGTTHPYYAVALAPAIAALVGIAGRELWRGRGSATARHWLAGMVAVTAVWSYVLLARDADYLPWLKFVVVAVGLVVTTVLVVGFATTRRAAVVLVAASVLTAGLGTAAYAVTTSSVAHGGSIPTSGPSSAGGTGPGAGGSTQGDPLSALLATTTTRWAAAVSGSQTAAGLEIAGGRAVIAIGGWSGTDDAPTLAQFQAAVANGEITYYVAGGGRGGGGLGGGSTGTEIATWVQENFTASTVGNYTVYDLTA